jgi:hypothetical protein
MDISVLSTFSRGEKKSTETDHRGAVHATIAHHVTPLLPTPSCRKLRLLTIYSIEASRSSLRGNAAVTCGVLQPRPKPRLGSFSHGEESHLIQGCCSPVADGGVIISY